MPDVDPAALLAMMPFAVATGVEVDRAAAEEVTGRLAWSPERCTAGFVMHGGALMTLADTVGAVCAFLNLPPGATTSTVASSTSLMRGVRGGTAQAVARPLHGKDLPAPRPSQARDGPLQGGRCGPRPRPCSSADPRQARRSSSWPGQPFTSNVSVRVKPADS